MSDDDAVAQQHPNPPGYEGKGLVIRASPCEHCLLGPKPLVEPPAVRRILRNCAKTDSHFVCHEATARGVSVMCSAFYDQNPQATNLMRIMGRLDGIHRIEGEALFALPVANPAYVRLASKTAKVLQARRKKRRVK